ncbi:MAG: HPP family protein, partial [Candidatus Aureabacteria bacterium]|nr:HPP family protein [Candidatus Auribacterota bacterium]
FKHHIGRYIFQCGLATFFFLTVLFFINALTHSAVIASLGATSFIVFTRPKWYSSTPRRLFGGYFVGMTVGIICYFLSELSFFSSILTTFRMSSIFWGAFAVGLAIFIMVVTDTEHPPAAGVALGLVIGEWDILTVVFICCALLFMYLLKRLFYPLLIDLI